MGSLLSVGLTMLLCIPIGLFLLIVYLVAAGDSEYKYGPPDHNNWFCQFIDFFDKPFLRPLQNKYLTVVLIGGLLGTAGWGYMELPPQGQELMVAWIVDGGPGWDQPDTPSDTNVETFLATGSPGSEMIVDTVRVAPNDAKAVCTEICGAYNKDGRLDSITIKPGENRDKIICTCNINSVMMEIGVPE